MNKFLKKIINSTCISYAICSFILNLIVWLTSSKGNQSRMLGILTNLFILFACLVISIIVNYKKRKEEAFISSLLTFASYTGIIYTISSLVVNTIQYIIKVENFWNGYTLIILLLFSIVVSFLLLKAKFKSFLISLIVNFFIIGIFYYIIFVIKSGFTKGNSLLISLSIYFIVYSLSSFIYYLTVRKRIKKENSEKNYTSLFS